MVVVLVPLAVIEFEAAVITVVEALGVPGVNVTTSSSTTGKPFKVPVTVADPVVVDDVRTAV